MLNLIYSEKYEKSMWTLVFGTFMGILITCLILWNRLIRDRLPCEINEEISTLGFYIVLYLGLYCFIITVSYIYRLYKKLRGIARTNVYIIKILNVLKTKKTLLDTIDYVVKYILDSPLFLWRFLYLNVPLKYRWLLIKLLYRFGIFLVKQLFTGNFVLKQIVVMLVMVYLPRIIVFSIFFYEILIMRKLELVLL